MTGADGKADGAVRQRPSGDAVGPHRASVGGAGGAMGAAALLFDWRPREAAHPLMLISPASDKRISSTFGDQAASRTAPACMNPQDAAGAISLPVPGEGGTISAR